jgi:death on curing protein
MSEPIWLTAKLITAVHEEQLRIYGGPVGVRDQGLLESALNRPRNKWAYGEKDLAALAAAHAFGLSRNHPFVDGNKRVSLLAFVTFLGLNGIRFRVPEPDITAAILALAAGDVCEDGLARWIRDRWPKA